MNTAFALYFFILALKDRHTLKLAFHSPLCFFYSNSVLQFCHIGVKSLQLYGFSLGPKDITVILNHHLCLHCLETFLSSLGATQETLLFLPVHNSKNVHTVTKGSCTPRSDVWAANLVVSYLYTQTRLMLYNINMAVYCVHSSAVSPVHSNVRWLYTGPQTVQAGCRAHQGESCSDVCQSRCEHDCAYCVQDNRPLSAVPV